MPDMELYALVIPEGARTRAAAQTRQSQAAQALLGQDTGSVESIGSEPGEQTLRVEFADELAEARAQELQELADGLSQPIPFHAVGERSREDRYVVVSATDIGPVDPRSRQYQRASSVRLSTAGTIASHWRRVRTAPTQVDHPFGNDQTAPVGVPAAATKVRWYDAETGATAVPTVTATRTSRLGDVDIVDALAAPYDRPELIFELDYSEEGKADPRVFDTRGEADIVDGDGALQWAKVFAPSHRATGDLVLTNGLLRLTVDEAADQASRPNAGTTRISSGPTRASARRTGRSSTGTSAR